MTKDRRQHIVIIGAVLSLGAPFGCSPDNPLDLTANPVNMKCDEVDFTYENFGKKFFRDYCLRCHSVTLETDLARLDAPLEINFDTMPRAREFKNRIRLRAGLLGDMPPQLLGGPFPSESERVMLIEWIDCGMSSENYPEENGADAAEDAVPTAESGLNSP